MPSFFNNCHEIWKVDMEKHKIDGNIDPNKKLDHFTLGDKLLM
jgi:hypothetical protein